jgi:hypothetical protein
MLVDLIRSHFVGFLDLVPVCDLDRPLADFLTSEGVLIRPNIYAGEYRVASPLIDGLVKRFVIPKKYPGAPSDTPPLSTGGRLIVIEILLGADEAWVVHFTCEDNYLDHPVWQSEMQLDEGGINVIHFWHDRAFSAVMMSARWKDNDGSSRQVHKQQLTF